MDILARPLIALTLTTLVVVGVGIELGAPGSAAQICAGLGAASASVGALRSSASGRAIFSALLGIFAGVLLLGSVAQSSPGTERLLARMSEEAADDHERERRLRAVLVGRVDGVGPASPRGHSIDLAVERLDGIDFGRERPTVRIFVPVDLDQTAEALPGDRVEVFARLDRYPGREFSRRRPVREVMAGRGLHVRATALESLAIGEAAEMEIFDGLRRRLVTSRARFERRLIDGLAPDHAALAVALTTGNRNYLEPEAVEPFRRTGTSHLLAISGLHLGVLAALLWAAVGVLANRVPWLLRRFGRRRVCGVAVIVLLGVYVLAIGAPVSATRAWVAIALGVGALMLLRPICPFHALAAAALGLVAAQPSVVAELAFQLSFAATGSILLFLRYRPDILQPPDDLFGAEEPPLRRRLRAAGLFVGVSTSATVGTWPILAAHLGEVPVLGLTANLVVTPLVSALLFPMLVAGVLVSLLVEPLGLWVVALSLDALLVARMGLEWVAQRPGATLVTGALEGGWLVAICAGAFLSVVSRWRPGRLCVAIVLLAVGLSPAFASSEAEANRELRVHFIPVGQGDATLVEFPDGTTMLVDGGGTRLGRDPGRFVVVPYLKRLGIDRLDSVVVTHSDADHLHGLFAVAEAMRPRRLVYDARDGSESLGELRGKIAGIGGELVGLDGVMAETVGGVALEIVRPQIGRGQGGGRGRNDASLVVRLARGPAAVLLPGDVEAAGERWLVANRPVRATVLKAPHHGSKTSSSSALIDAVRPRVSIVSAGRFNHFGHPHSGVMWRYRSRGVRLFETARRGLVRVDVDREGMVEVRSVR